jgi:hypothetical protein
MVVLARGPWRALAGVLFVDSGRWAAAFIAAGAAADAWRGQVGFEMTAAG